MVSMIRYCGGTWIKFPVTMVLNLTVFSGVFFIGVSYPVLMWNANLGLLEGRLHQ